VGRDTPCARQKRRANSESKLPSWHARGPRPAYACSGRVGSPESASSIRVKHELIGPPPGRPRAEDSSRAAESFRDLLLRHRGRTELTELPDRASANRRTGRDWEAAR
jgi:hypothetical protein